MLHIAAPDAWLNARTPDVVAMYTDKFADTAGTKPEAASRSSALQSNAPVEALHAETALPPIIAKIMPLAMTGENNALVSDVSNVL